MAAGTGAAPADGGGTPVGELSYTEASRELDAIVAYFEQRDVDVDLLVARLERATALVGELDRRLRRTRVQVEQLVPKLAAVLADGDTDDGDTDEDGDGLASGAEAATEDARNSGTDRVPCPTGVDVEVTEVVVTEVEDVGAAGGGDHGRRRPFGGTESPTDGGELPGLF